AKNNGVLSRHDSNPKAPIAAEKPPKFYTVDDVKKLLLNKRKLTSTKHRLFLSLNFQSFFAWTNESHIRADVVVFGICDGHGGVEAAKSARKHPF
ncbi:phosphatase 2C (PP2C)-like protein, partial [Corchorus capsularis]